MRKLIIAEKPNVAKKIAKAISQSTARKQLGDVPYYVSKENGDEVVVAAAAGHLYGLVEEGDGREYPIFSIAWKPLYEVDKFKSYTKKYISALSTLSQGIEEFIVATDWDIEGEILGFNALRFSCGRERAKRMRFSTLVPGELREAYKNLASLDYALASAGEARHILDWYWGINISRALMRALSRVGKKFVLSAGRVQTPALAILAKREKEIALFTPEKFFELLAEIKIKGVEVKAKHILTLTHTIDALTKSGFACVMINSLCADLPLKSSSLLFLGGRPRIVLHEIDEEVKKRLPPEIEVSIVETLEDEIKKTALKGKVGIEKTGFVESLEKADKSDCEISIIKNIEFEAKKSEEEARLILERSKTKEATVTKVEKTQRTLYPPVPFDLGELQAESYRVFKYSPKKTQDIAQSLYESGCISYPRTSSQKLPLRIGFRYILQNLAAQTEFKTLAELLLKKEKLFPREGKKEDPAHPAIYPTGIMPKEMKKETENVYKLIVFRFLSVFANSALAENVKMVFRLNSEEYLFSYQKIIERGWLDFYPYAESEDISLPEIKEGGAGEVLKVDVKESATKPPPRYTPASVIKELERLSLGTKATRADIIETLYGRKYITGTQIYVTELGMAVAEALEKYVPEIISTELTRKFEDELELISLGKLSKEKVLEDAKSGLKVIISEFSEREQMLGDFLKSSLEKMDRKNVIGKCIKCGGELKIIKSGKTGKIFVGCSNYPACRAAFPLPQSKKVHTTESICNACGLPMISISLGRKRMLSCIDMNCSSKKKIPAGN